MRKYEVKNILGVNVANITLKNIVPTINDLIERKRRVTVFGANPHAINLYQTNSEFRKAFDNTTLIYPEGIGTVIASKILAHLSARQEKSLQGKTTLMDYIYNLFELAKKRKWSIYILGGREEVSDQALMNLKNRFPHLKIQGHHGYFSEKETRKIIAGINEVKPTILFVAMGSPKQEVWIDKHKDKINSKAFLGIGGSIDIIAGVIPRAPKIVRSVGLEWVYRTYKEPKRLWRRYIIGNVIFLSRVMCKAFWG